ncbi:hypothetical protein HK102_001084 [Quaeritorhiza haematococci]|nr:hypothetical protein HK102_001084 [Quaeritorhiza haematococci]
MKSKSTSGLSKGTTVSPRSRADGSSAANGLRPDLAKDMGSAESCDSNEMQALRDLLNTNEYPDDEENSGSNMDTRDFAYLNSAVHDLFLRSIAARTSIRLGKGPYATGEGPSRMVTETRRGSDNSRFSSRKGSETGSILHSKKFFTGLSAADESMTSGTSAKNSSTKQLEMATIAIERVESQEIVEQDQRATKSLRHAFSENHLHISPHVMPIDPSGITNSVSVQSILKKGRDVSRGSLLPSQDGSVHSVKADPLNAPALPLGNNNLTVPGSETAGQRIRPASFSPPRDPERLANVAPTVLESLQATDASADTKPSENAEVTPTRLPRRSSSDRRERAKRRQQRAQAPLFPEAPLDAEIEQEQVVKPPISFWKSLRHPIEEAPYTKWNLKFHPGVESLYSIYIYHLLQASVKKALWFFTVGWFIYAVFTIALFSNLSHIIRHVGTAAAFLTTLTAAILSHQKSYANWYQVINMVWAVVIALQSILISVSDHMNFAKTDTLQIPPHFVLANSVVYVTMNFIGFYYRYTSELFFRRAFVKYRGQYRCAERLIEAREQSEQLLRMILPGKIIEQLRKFEQKPDGAKMHETFMELDGVTVMFADIVGFTEFSSMTKADRLVAILSEIFAEFDSMIADFDLEKIKTIGDCIQVAGGVPDQLPDAEMIARSAEKVCFMALLMIETMKAISRKIGYTLQLRVGIHTGSVIGGVIGLWKFKYGKDFTR